MSWSMIIILKSSARSVCLLSLLSILAAEIPLLIPLSTAPSISLSVSCCQWLLSCSHHFIFVFPQRKPWERGWRLIRWHAEVQNLLNIYIYLVICWIEYIFGMLNWIHAICLLNIYSIYWIYIILFIEYILNVLNIYSTYWIYI